MTLRLHQIEPEDPASAFPSTRQALLEPNGLLALGGDLSTERLIAAYQRGIFPWFSENEPILWWSPSPRTVFIPGDVHVSRRLQRRLRKQDFAITLDRAFNQVVQACAQPRNDADGTWLLPSMRQAYAGLYELGYAHSIEVWHEGRLCGGLYGLALGRAFFGESMFSHQRDMSKIALAFLDRLLSEWGYIVFDAQVASPHLFSMGACEINRVEFEKLLHRAIPKIPQPGLWQDNGLLPKPLEHLPAGSELQI